MKKFILIIRCLKAKNFKWALYHLQGKNIFEEAKKRNGVDLK